MGGDTMHRELFRGLSPIHHHSLLNHYRVPLYIDGDTYTLWVGEGHTRTFYADELPNLVKSKIAMVLASPIKELVTVQEAAINIIYVYHNRQYPELDEVGWRVTDKLLCLVLPNQIIDSLKGELLTKE
jgi:hypothetical protein